MNEVLGELRATFRGAQCGARQFRMQFPLSNLLVRVTLCRSVTPVRELHATLGRAGRKWGAWMGLKSYVFAGGKKFEWKRMTGQGVFVAILDGLGVTGC